MNHRLPWIILILLILVLLLPLALLALQPTGSFVNPLPRSDQADTSEVKTLGFYLGTTQASLAKARQLANGNNHQTQADKQQIIQVLNQALDSANQAVAAYPQDPRAYQQRAEVLLSVSHLQPQAKTLAEQDLATAQNLAGGQTNPLPQANPLETLPIEQANLAQNVTIAAPASQGDPLPEQGVALHSNVTKGTVVLPAGQTSKEVRPPGVKRSDLSTAVIYLIPQGNTLNHPLYIKSKTSTSFTLAIDEPVNADLTIDYWIINQDNKN